MSKFTVGHRRSAKLTPEQVLDMRRLYAEEGWSQGRLARHFCLSVGQVGRIVRGEQWQDYPQVLTDQEIEHRMAILPQPDAATLEESMARLSEKLLNPLSPGPKEIDPLEEVLRKRGGANPLARRSSQPSEAGGELAPSDDQQTEEDSQP